MKRNAESSRNIATHSFKVGDRVLVRQAQPSKLTPLFDTKPLTIVSVNHSMLTAQNDERTVVRNASHFKSAQQLPLHIDTPSQPPKEIKKGPRGAVLSWETPLSVDTPLLTPGPEALLTEAFAETETRGVTETTENTETTDNNESTGDTDAFEDAALNENPEQAGGDGQECPNELTTLVNPSETGVALRRSPRNLKPVQRLDVNPRLVSYAPPDPASN